MTTNNKIQTEAMPAVLWRNEAEQAVLGALMLDGGAYQRIEGKLVSEDFYHAHHQIIFRAIVRLHADMTPIDVVTVAEFLNNQRRRGKENDDENLLEEIGGIAYLGLLVRDTAGAANIHAYAAAVRDYSIKRKAVAIAAKTQEFIYYPDGRNVTDVIAEAEQNLANLAALCGTKSQPFRSTNELLSGAIDLIEKRFNADNLLTGVPTGWSRFDAITCGLQPGDLVIIAGRPSMGKSCFAMNIAERISVESEKLSAVFSLEMTGEQLMMRMLSSRGRINHERVRTGKLYDSDWPRLASAAAEMNNKPMYVNDSTSIKASDIAALARDLHRKNGGIGCIVVDYIQLMIPENSRRNETRSLELSDITRRLKLLAKDLGCPVIAISQLNRSLEQRANKRPMMSDLRESGAIEQDADVIVFVYRDKVYDENSMDENGSEIIIAKQRNGPIGRLPFVFLGEYQRFEETELPYLPSWQAKKSKRSTEEFSDDVADLAD